MEGGWAEAETGVAMMGVATAGAVRVEVAMVVEETVAAERAVVAMVAATAVVVKVEVAKVAAATAEAARVVAATELQTQPIRHRFGQSIQR